MHQMTPKLLLDSDQFPSKIYVNLFCKKPLFGPKKMKKDAKNGRKLVWISTYVHAS